MDIRIPLTPIRITTKPAYDATIDAKADVLIEDNSLGTARQLAAQHIAGLAKKQLANMAWIERNAKRITKIILACSIPHQALYIWEKTSGQLAWDSVNGVLHSLSSIVAAAGMPFIGDVATLLAIMLCGAPIAATWARWVGAALMLPSVAASSYVNYNAPGDRELCVIFAASVVFIPIVQGIAILSEVINWAKMLEMEQKVADQVGISILLPQPPSKKCPTGCKCLKHTENKPTITAPPKPPRKPTTAKASQTRKPTTKAEPTEVDGRIDEADAVIAATVAEFATGPVRNVTAAKPTLTDATV